MEQIEIQMVIQRVIQIGLYYLIFMSFLGYAIMGIDKWKAKNKGWRIPEKTLFFIAFLGGGIGSCFGMFLFRHKTKHRKFTLLLPLSAVLYGVVIIKLITLLL